MTVEKEKTFERMLEEISEAVQGVTLDVEEKPFEIIKEKTTSQDLSKKIEALLFISTEPLSIKKLSEITGKSGKEIESILVSLKDHYSERGIIIQEIAGGWQMRTNPDCHEVVTKFLKAKPFKLSEQSLETLAIIAYKQPVTKAEIEEIRGVDSSGNIKLLLELKLIRVMGKKQVPGRPLLYGTTDKFLEVFGIKSLHDLPSLREIRELVENPPQLEIAGKY